MKEGGQKKTHKPRQCETMGDEGCAVFSRQHLRFAEQIRVKGQRLRDQGIAACDFQPLASQCSGSTRLRSPSVLSISRGRLRRFADKPAGLHTHSHCRNH